MYLPDFEAILLFRQSLATVSTILMSPSTLGITFQAWLSRTACSFNFLVIGSLLTFSYYTRSYTGNLRISFCRLPGLIICAPCRVFILLIAYLSFVLYENPTHIIGRSIQWKTIFQFHAIRAHKPHCLTRWLHRPSNCSWSGEYIKLLNRFPWRLVKFRQDWYFCLSTESYVCESWCDTLLEMGFPPGFLKSTQQLKSWKRLKRTYI